MEPSAYLLLRRFRRMSLVDLLHYPLSPSDRIGNGSYGSRNPRSAVVLRQFFGPPKSRQRSAARAFDLRPLRQSSTFALCSPSRLVLWLRTLAEYGTRHWSRGSRRPFYVVTKVGNKGWDRSADPNHVWQPKRPRIGLQRESASAETVPLLCQSAPTSPHKTAQLRTLRRN